MVLHHQVRAFTEQLEDGDLAVRAVEDVILLDPDRGQPAPFGVGHVAPAG